MWPFADSEREARFKREAEQRNAEIKRADLMVRVGAVSGFEPFLRGHEDYAKLPRSVNELYAMIDALEKRVRELESRG